LFVKVLRGSLKFILSRQVEKLTVIRKKWY